MAISLKNIEDRVKKLEESGVSTWQRGNNSNGYWAKETTTGLIIQWGNISRVLENYTATLPISFSTSSYSVLASIKGQSYDPAAYKLYVERLDASRFRISHRGIGDGPGMWTAIGYLITDRLLNILYKAFARNIYTQLWQKLVSKIFTS